jgi:hypothetical protein
VLPTGLFPSKTLYSFVIRRCVVRAPPI